MVKHVCCAFLQVDVCRMVFLWSHDMRFRCPRDNHVVPGRRLQIELWQRLESLL